MKYASIGSVSSGTLRQQDLLDTFSNELEYHVNRNLDELSSKEVMRLAKLIGEASMLAALYDDDGENTQWIEFSSDALESLEMELQAFAPDYVYFGADHGDGACFGFWLNDDALNNFFDGLRVSDLSEVPDGYVGEVLLVNDHGNMTLYTANNGKLSEVWGVV